LAICKEFEAAFNVYYWQPCYLCSRKIHTSGIGSEN
jgi:hypothetical protein